MVEHQLPKLTARVRFPSPAPQREARQVRKRIAWPLSYSSTWSGIGDFVAGAGWNPGSSSTKSSTSRLSASGGTTLLSLYGWSTSPLVEYYVEENWVGSPNTADGQWTWHSVSCSTS